MDSLIHEFAHFLRQHLTSISVGAIATLLMLVGSTINGFFKKITKGMPFLGRFALFVLLCSAGYALLSSQLVRLLRWFLAGQSDLLLIVILAASYIGLAVLAYRGRDI